MVMKNPINQRRLFAKSFLRYFAWICIPTLVIGGITVSLARHLFEEYARSFSAQPAQRISQYFTQIENYSSTLEDLVSKDSYAGGSLQDILLKDTLNYADAVRLAVFSGGVNALANNNPDIDSIYVYWPNEGERILESNRGIVLSDLLADQDWKVGCPSDFASLPQITWYAQRRMIVNSKVTVPVVTVYRKIYSLDYQRSQGLIAINYSLINLEDFLGEQALFSRQKIAVLNAAGQIVAGNLGHWTDLAPLQDIATMQAQTQVMQWEQNGYTFSVNPVGDTSLLLVSSIPNDQLYAVPRRLTMGTLIAVGLAMIVSLTLAARYSAHAASYVRHILDVFDAAQNGQELPSSPVIKDEQSYILNRLIFTFVQQEQLKVQLAEKNYQARSMELVALQAQINPHFLFNTMEVIKFRAFSLTNGANDVTLLIENLSSILRYTLREPQQLVPFDQELEYAQAYLWIQNFRFRDVFHVEWCCAPHIENFLVPKLVLQPIIENAISHGIRPSGRCCTLTIRVSLDDPDTLLIHIQDDGVGMAPERLKQLRDSLASKDVGYEHIGLRNTAKRLSLLYGEKARVTVDSHLDAGTTVCLYIPKQTVLSEDLKEKGLFTQSI